jgi:hypothetical protein
MVSAPFVEPDTRPCDNFRHQEPVRTPELGGIDNSLTQPLCRYGLVNCRLKETIMMFATTLRNRVIVAAGAAGILAAGGLGIITPTAAYATESSAPVSLATSTRSVETGNLSQFPCFFGTHGGKGHGCRGGSLIDVPAAKQATKQTLHEYKDAGECAIASTAIGLVSTPVPTLPTVASKSITGAISCGMAKGY